MDLTSIQVLLLCGAFGGAAVLVMLVNHGITARRRTVAERMRSVRVAQGREDIAAELVGTARAQRRLPPLVELFSGSVLVQRLDQRLTAAGIALRPWEFAAIAACSTMLGALVGAAALRSVLGAALLGGAGYWLPLAVVGWCEARRKALLEKQLATAVRLIAASMQAGHAFQTSLATAAEQLPPPISEEFERVVGQVNHGIGVEPALEQMARRIDSYDFDLFASAVSIQLRSGGRLSAILDNIAATIRQRMTLHREVAAASAQGKLSGFVLVLVPIGIAGALMFINREYGMLLFTTPIGMTLTKVAVGMQLVGILVIRRMLQIRV